MRRIMKKTSKIEILWFLFGWIFYLLITVSLKPFLGFPFHYIVGGFVLLLCFGLGILLAEEYE